MTESENSAAEILAMKDKVANGDKAKPSSDWGVMPRYRANAYDDSLDELQRLNPKALEDLLDRLTGEVK